MKFDFKKIVVPTLAIAIGAAIAGSVSGTVAWYQYSTRVSTAYLGTTAGTAGNLKLRIAGTDDWLNSLTKEDIETYLKSQHIGNKHMGEDLIPITAGNIGSDVALNKIGGDGADKDLPKFYKNPVRGYEEQVKYSSPAWLKADQTMYVQIPLEIAFIEYDGKPAGETKEDKAYLQKNVYISDLLIQEDWQNDSDPEALKKDLSSAVRVHISSYRDDDESAGRVDSTFNRLISKDGGSILTKGYLDLDGDSRDDTYFNDGNHGAAYGFGNSASIAASTKKVVYGEGIQTAYKAATEGVAQHSYKELDESVVNDPIYPAVVKSKNNSTVLDEEDFEFTKEGASEKTSKCIGHTIAYDKTSADWEQKFLNVTITIWLEGWQTLPAPTPSDANAVSSIWNAADYIGSMFDVGIQFAVQAE